MTTLFVSDLHLDAARPQVTRLFLDFLRDEAAHAEALYILGDLFEAWVGDDMAGEPSAAVHGALRELADAGVPVFVMRGNRDFLLGAQFAAEAGVTLLPDPAVVVLNGEPTLLMHGDLLCTDDAAYQAFRQESRKPDWQERFLAKPLAERLAFAAHARAASREHQDGLKESGALEAITDVNATAVVETLARYGLTRLIHGHTHRPAIHALDVDGHSAQRIVLGDWYEQGSVLRASADGFVLASLS